MKNKNNIKCILTILAMISLFFYSPALFAQAQSIEHHVLIDISHGQKFWNDPNDMAGKDPGLIERIRYMTGEITKTAASVNADIGYVKGKIKPADLAKCDLLFIHLPSSQYDAEEVSAIKQYIEKGGALFLVMDANYWSTLQQTNVNDMIIASGITFGEDSPDTVVGGYSMASSITDKNLKIPYHGGRVVSGGTPFSYFNDGKDHPFGVYTNYKKGKVVAMGDGMVSLYMNEWKDVKDYQCSEFMHEVFAWLLK